MRKLFWPLAALLLLAGCGTRAASNAVATGDGAAPAAQQANAATPEPAPANKAIATEPPDIPGVGEMSPYRRREYERGYRDCSRGAFDRERQGESYRIGCMAAEEARER